MNYVLYLFVLLSNYSAQNLFAYNSLLNSRWSMLTSPCHCWRTYASNISTYVL